MATLPPQYFKHAELKKKNKKALHPNVLFIIPQTDLQTIQKSVESCYSNVEDIKEV